MICQNPPTSTQTNQFSLSLHSNPLKENSSGANIYSPSNYQKFGEMQEPNSKKQNCSLTETSIKGMSDLTGESFSNMIFGNKYASHWEVVEGYFVEHLTSIKNEIEKCTTHKDQLTKARDELIQEVLLLHKKTIDLNTKNEHLTRVIAEKENKISAFMYQPPPPPPITTATEEVERSKKASHRRRSVVGVTLTDIPYSPEVATMNNDIIQSYVPENVGSKSTGPSPQQNNQDSTKGSLSTKKETTTGIFRQLSRKISRKKKHHDENSSQNSNNSSKNNNNNSRSSSDSRSDSHSNDMPTEELLHPAVVISATDDKKEERAAKDVKSKSKNRLMFGNNIVDQARSENTVVPYIVLKCVREVEFRGLKVEGIYRKSGSYNQVTELKDAFDQNKTPDLSRYDDINVISSLLKLYLRESPIPLLPQEFIIDPSFDAKTRLNKTHHLLHSLPIETYSTIKTIMQHLKRVHQSHSFNRMTSKNLAVVFGPTLMRFSSHGNEEQQMNNMIQTVDFIIAQSHLLFADF